MYLKTRNTANLNIAIDIDGVICDFSKAFIATVNRERPRFFVSNYTPVHWDYHDRLTAYEMQYFWDKTVETPRLWQNLQPLPGVSELHKELSRLSNYGVSIYYITNRQQSPGPPPLEQTNIWLDTFRLRGRHTSTIIVPNSASKAGLMRDLNTRFSLDDKPETVDACNQVTGHSAYLFDANWNQGFNLPRVKSVSEYLRIVMNFVDRKITVDNREDVHER